LIRARQRIRNFIFNTWFVDATLLAILVLFGVYLISGIFRPGLMYQYDHSQHLVESVYVSTVLIPKYHQLIGWNPYYYLGYPQGQFDPPMGYAIYALLYYVFSSVASDLEIYKGMIAFFYILPAITLYVSARMFGLNRLSGFFGGLFAIGTAGGFEQSGPLGMMEYGMYEYSASIALIPLVLGLYHYSLQRKSWFLILTTGLATAFVFLLHTIGGVFLLVVLGVYTVIFLGKQAIFHRANMQLMKTIAKFAAIVVIMVGLSSFWIIPAYVNQSYYYSQKSLVTELGNYGVTYNDYANGLVFGEKTVPYTLSLFPTSSPQILVSLYNDHQVPTQYSSLLFYQVLMALAAIGIIVALIRRQSRLPALVAVTCIAIFVIISLGPTYYEWLWQSKLFHLIDIRPARAAAPARIFLSLLAGVGIGDGMYLLVRALSKRQPGTRGYHASRILKFVSVFIILLFAVSLVANSLSLMTQINLAGTTDDISTASDLPQLFQWLNQNVPNTSRIATEEYPGSQQHLFAITPLYTGKQVIGSEYGFWWSGAAASTSVSTMLSYSYYYSTGAVFDTLSGLNAGYVVVWKTETKYYLTESSRFQLVKQIGVFDVLKLAGYTPSYVEIYNGTGNASVTAMDPESIVIKVSNVTAGSDLLLKMSYFGNWVGSMGNGDPLTVKPVNIQLPLLSVNYTEVPLPRSGNYNITLSYSPRPSNAMASDISGVTFLFAILGMILIAMRNTYDLSVSEYLARSARKATGLVRGTLTRPYGPPGDARQISNSEKEG